MHINRRIENVLIKSQGVLKCCGHWLSDGWVEKMVLHKNVGAWWDFPQKCQCSWIYKKIIFYSHLETFNETNFKLILCICIVISTIVITKTIGKLVQYQFLGIFKDAHHGHFGFVDKTMPCFLFKLD